MTYICSTSDVQQDAALTLKL